MDENINLELDDLLDDFDGQFDLLNFEKEEYIPLEYDLDKIFNHLNSNEDCLEITFEKTDDDNCISTILSKEEFKEVYNKISNNCDESIKNDGLINTYISFGSIQYDEDIAPCILIPIFIKELNDDYFICRNPNHEINSNVLFKWVFEEDNLDLPVYEEDVEKLIKQLNETENIEYRNEAYIANFDLRFQHIFNDIRSVKWDNLNENIKLYLNKKDTLNFTELNDLQDDLRGYANQFSIDFDKDLLFLKSLLSQNYSILVISDYSTIEDVKKSFADDNIDSLILNLSDDLSVNDFYEQILDNDFNSQEENLNFSLLIKDRENAYKIHNLINSSYFSNFDSTPKRIKEMKDHYLKKIDKLNIEDYTYNFKDIARYSNKRINEEFEEFKQYYFNHKRFLDFYNQVSWDYLNSEDFESLIEISKSIKNHLNSLKQTNMELNDLYSIKIFDDLVSINILDNFDCLDTDPNYIGENDLKELNDSLMEFHLKNNIKSNKFENYFNEDNPFEVISMDIKFTELIDGNIIPYDSDFDKLNSNSTLNQVNYFIAYSKFVSKEFFKIFDFYNNTNPFDIDNHFLDINNGFEDLNRLIQLFSKHIGELIDFKKNYMPPNFKDENVEKLFYFALEHDFNEEDIKVLYLYNIFNSFLMEFLENNDFIDENKIISDYDLEFEELDKKFNLYNKKEFFQKIHSLPEELDNSQIRNQKEDLIQMFNKNELDSIKNVLRNYKEFIMANKRVFLMDISMVSQFLDNAYESCFDFVILTDNINYYKLDKLSLLLRSKEKIILIKE